MLRTERAKKEKVSNNSDKPFLRLGAVKKQRIHIFVSNKTCSILKYVLYSHRCCGSINSYEIWDNGAVLYPTIQSVSQDQLSKFWVFAMVWNISLKKNENFSCFYFSTPTPFLPLLSKFDHVICFVSLFCMWRDISSWRVIKVDIVREKVCVRERERCVEGWSRWSYQAGGKDRDQRGDLWMWLDRIRR